jgi:hypothetical protein
MQNHYFFTFDLYGYETVVTLREYHGLRVFGNKVLRRIFGSERARPLTEDLWKLHIDEL